MRNGTSVEHWTAFNNGKIKTIKLLFWRQGKMILSVCVPVHSFSLYLISSLSVLFTLFHILFTITHAHIPTTVLCSLYLIFQINYGRTLKQQSSRHRIQPWSISSFSWYYFWSEKKANATTAPTSFCTSLIRA